jgi:hypothetical protein
MQLHTSLGATPRAVPHGVCVCVQDVDFDGDSNKEWRSTLVATKSPASKIKEKHRASSTLMALKAGHMGSDDVN